MSECLSQGTIVIILLVFALIVLPMLLQGIAIITAILKGNDIKA